MEVTVSIQKLQRLRASYPEKFWNFIRDYALNWSRGVKLEAKKLYTRYMYADDKAQLLRLLKEISNKTSLRDPLFSNHEEVYRALIHSNEMDAGIQVGVDKATDAIISLLKEDAVRMKAELSHLGDLIKSMRDINAAQESMLKACRKREDELMQQIVDVKEGDLPPIPPPPPPLAPLVDDALRTISAVKPEQSIVKVENTSRSLGHDLQDEIRKGLKLKPVTPSEKKQIEEESNSIAAMLKKGMEARRKAMMMNCTVCAQPATYACRCMNIAQCDYCVIPEVHEGMCPVEEGARSTPTSMMLVIREGQYKVLDKKIGQDIPLKLKAGIRYVFTLGQDFSEYPLKIGSAIHTQIGSQFSVMMMGSNEEETIQCTRFRHVKLELKSH